MHYHNLDQRRHTTVATESLAQLPTTRETGDERNTPSAATGEKKRSAVINVLIVDDHTLMREGLSQLLTLEGDIQVVGGAIDGFDAIEKIRRLQPDIVLMDIHLPVVDGIAITRQITYEFPTIAVIMLSMYQQNQQIVEAMKNGARGYLLKSSSAHELAQAIRVVRDGEIAMAPALTGAIVNELRRQPETSATGQNSGRLSEKELEIIRYLAAGMSNKEIAECLAYSEKTVKNYLSIIFQKLHLRDRTQVAIFALRQGLLPVDILPSNEVEDQQSLEH